MTPNSPNPHAFGLNPSPGKAAVYRPKYRTRMANPTYALEGTTAVREGEISGFMDALDALEQWRAEDEQREAACGVRWRPEKLASLRVFLPETQNSETLHSIFWQACREWEAMATGQLQFVPSRSAEDADIVVQIQDETVLGRDFEVGHTDRDIQPPQWIQRARITLIHAPAIDEKLSPRQIHQRLLATCLHELGHALGLEHSRNSRDVMHHQGWRNTRLTANDGKRLIQLNQAPSKISTWL